MATPEAALDLKNFQSEKPNKKTEDDPDYPQEVTEQMIADHRDYILKMVHKFLATSSELDKQQREMAAEDIAQETMLKALRYKNNYNPQKGKFTTWLGEIAKKLVFDFWRRRSTKTRRIEQTKSDEQHEAVWYFDKPSMIKTDPIIRKRLEQAIKSLPERRQQILTLLLKGKTPEEVAAQVGVSIKTVRSAMHKIKAKLREEMAEQGIDIEEYLAA